MLSPRGNVVTSDIVKGLKKEIRSDLEALHERKGNVRLLPSHLLKIRDYCFSVALAKGEAIGIFFIMLWCMILVGTFLFLRSSELLALKLKDFIKRAVLLNVTQ